MKRKDFGKYLLMFFAVALLCFAGVCTAAADDTYTVNVTGTYGQTEARSMLAMINEFRTGAGAYFKNTDGSENTDYVGKLSELTYDYKLEEYAMQRAIEIAVSFSHTRPDGTNTLCASFWTENGYSSRGENIAAGQTSAEKAFNSWLEADEDYSGQGHRQNMLGVNVKSDGTVETLNYTSIGIGHVYYNGIHYWVQEFGDETVTASATTANDAETTVPVVLANSVITEKQVTFSPESLSFTVGTETALPTVSIKIKTGETWPNNSYRPITLDSISWTSADSTIAAISEESVTGAAVGTTSISTTILGEEQTVSVTVEEIDLTNATVTAYDVAYTGSALEPTPTVTLGGSVLSASCYTVAYTDNVNAGTATVTVTGTGNYKGTASGTFTIAAAPMDSCSTTAIATQTYTGSALEPALTVTYGSLKLTAGTDYTIVYSDNTAAGTATVTLTGSGNYTGTKTVSFTIDRFDISGCTVDAIADQTYMGEALTPSVTVKYGSLTLTAGTDYMVEYSNNTNVGTATATLTGAGNYTGTKEVSFTINPLDISGCTVDAIADQTYIGKALTPAVTVKNGSVTLTINTDYTLSYSSNVDAGTATVTIKGSGNYEGSLQASFTIKGIDLAAKGTLAFADETAYTYDGNAKEPGVTVTVGTKTLAAGTDYTVSYENNTAAGAASVVVNGMGNYEGTLEKSFTISPRSICEGKLGTFADCVYTGSAQTPAVTVTDNGKTLAENSDYKVSYEDNVNVGTAKVTVAGIGNYTESLTGSFTIGQADIAKCTVADLSAQYYTGEAITPEVSITLENYTLVKDTDYILSYANNTAVGTATVTIQGIGNFEGSAEVKFTIQTVPTETTTDTPTETTTEISAETSTEASTESSTEASTEASTEESTESSTEAQTEASTEASTESPMEVSTEKPAEVTTNAATEPTPTPTPKLTATNELSEEDDDTDSEETDEGRVVPEGGMTLTDAKTGAVYRVTQESADADPVAVYQKPQNAKAASVVIPDMITVNGRSCKVTAIADSAFRNNRVLKKVKIGKYVQTIGKNAFSGCTKLTSVTGGASLTKIGDSAFQKCTALKKITIPAKVKSIGRKAFYGCKNLHTVTIKTKLLTAKTIGAKAFAGTYKKATVKVPASKLKLYKKVLLAKGLSKSAKVKK